MNDAIRTITDAWTTLERLGVVEQAREYGGWIVAAVSIVVAALVVVRTVSAAWKVAKWSGRKVRHLGLATWRMAFPLPPAPEPISLACSTILAQLDDECAMLKDRLLEAGTLRIRLSLGELPESIRHGSDDKYNVLDDLNDREKEMIRNKVMATILRVRERDRQARLAGFISQPSHNTITAWTLANAAQLEACRSQKSA